MDLFSPEERETILNTSKKSFPAVQDDIKKYVMKYYKVFCLIKVVRIEHLFINLLNLYRKMSAIFDKSSWNHI